MSDLPFPWPASFSTDSTIETALGFLDLVYEAAESPSALRKALTLLAELVGSPSVLLFAVEGGEQRLIAAAQAEPRPANDSGAVPAKGGRVRTVPLSRALELVVDLGPMQPLQEAVLLRLTPHLARALRLAERHAHDEQRDEQSAERLDRVSLPVVLLDANGRVVFLNRAARSLVGATTALELDLAQQRIVPRAGATRALFEELIERVTAPPDPDRKFVGGRLVLTDGQSGRIDVVVAPFAAQIAKIETRAVLLLSGHGASPTPEERLCDLCGLSSEEARVAIDVVAGSRRFGNGDRAATEATLASIYRKLGTTRQVDLLRLLIRPPGVVFESVATRARAI